MNEAQKSRPHNSTYLKVAVQWLNQALCLIYSEVLLNRRPRVAANRYGLFFLLFRFPVFCFCPEPDFTVKPSSSKSQA